MTSKGIAELEALRRDVTERQKELRCLYEVFEATEDLSRSQDALLAHVAGLLPAAWMFSDDAAARIRFGAGVFTTAGFTETPWTQTARFATGAETGDVTVSYRSEHPTAAEGPFLSEERQLLDTIARRLGEVLSRREERKAEEGRREFITAVFEQATDAIGLIDLETRRFVEFNTAAHANLGYDREAFARLSTREYLVDPEEVSEANRQQILRDGFFVGERKNRHRDGHLIDVLASGRVVELKGRKYLAVVWTDISSQKQLQAALRRSNRELRAITEAMRCVVFAQSEPELLERVCAAVAASGGYLTAWIGFAQQDAERSVKPVAAAGPHADYTRALKISWSDERPEGRGPTGHCIRERVPVALRSTMSDPRFAPWREAAEKHGFGSSIALPLLMPEDGPAQGALMVYSEREEAFDPAEIELLQGLADTVSFGLRALRDREARAEAQRNAEATAKRLSNLHEASPVVVYTVAVGGERFVPLEVSDNGPRLLGYPMATLMSPDFWASHLHPDDRARAFAASARVLQGEHVHHEFRFRHADGRWLWIHDDLRPIADETGRITRAVGAWTNVTARRAADEEVRKLSMAVEQSIESVIVTDLAANIEYVNEAFVRNTGYQRAEVIGQNPRMLQSGKTPPATYRDLWATLTAGKPWRGEFINRRKDGTEQIEAAVILPLREPDGRVTHYVAVKHDVTETVRMTRELEQHRRHLEELVEQRTAELAVAREKAEAANVAKSAFLANMSHEIRTPMNAIIGYTHLLRQADPTPAQAERLKKIDASAHHLLDLINDILDLSKVEAGRLTLEHVDFDPGHVVTEVLELLRQRSDEKGLPLLAEVDAALPATLNGDPLRLRQVLLNLGSNAVKFTERGRVVLRAAVLERTAERVVLRFQAEDTGIGMTPEQLGRLFRAFEQADASTTRNFGGTGLGLAISKNLVGMMGGTIEVVSAPGQGSTFTVTLPFEVPSAAVRASESGLRVAPHSRARAAEIRILLVEDDAMNQEVAGEILRSQGYLVDIANNGAEAIAAVERHDYQLVLMDVQMPVMDGITATRELRRTAAGARLPIVAMTASAFGDDRDRCLEAGMNDFVTKPVDPARLYLAVARWTRGRGTGAPTDGAPPRSASSPALGHSLLAALAGVDGLDLQQGLRFLQGQADSYERLLARYVETRHEDVERLRRHLAAGELQDAVRMAHTLKGLAATLGATRVHAAAQELEAALRANDRAASEGLVERLLEVHLALIEQLRSRLHLTPTPVPTAPPEGLDWADARQRVRRLERLLADDDVLATIEWQQAAAVLTQALGDAAAPLARHVRAFEFDLALGVLRRAVEREPRLSGPQESAS